MAPSERHKLRTILWSIVAAGLVLRKKRVKPKRVRSAWALNVQETLTSATPFRELRLENNAEFETHVNIPLDAFNRILEKIAPLVSKQDTLMRYSIPAGLRLEATLMLLTNLDYSYRTISKITRISMSSLSTLVYEACLTIFDVLKKDYLKTPTTADEWENIAKQNEIHWKFPNCLGAIDGKHIQIRPPPNAGTKYLNYRETNSIPVVAAVGANYEFIWVDVGTHGRESDHHIWNDSSLCTCIDNSSLPTQEDYFPKPKEPPNSNVKLPFVFVADEAFPQNDFLLKPCPLNTKDIEEKVFSYRHSRMHQTVENAFGILATKFKVLQSTIMLEPKRAESVILACVVLHNFLRREYTNEYTPPGSLDTEIIEECSISPGMWRNSESLVPLQRTCENYERSGVSTIKNEFLRYFNEEGAVPWQRDMVNSLNKDRS